MKKSTIIIIITALILVTFAAWAVGYSFLSNHATKTQVRGFMNDCEEFLSSDEAFISQYGELVALDALENSTVVETRTDETIEYYMDFNCTTSNGVFNIRVHLTYNELWAYSFEELN